MLDKVDEIRRAELPQRDKRLRSGIDRLVEDLFGQAERGLAMRRLGRFAIGVLTRALLARPW